MFDFLNSEDKLLLTQFPRFARAPEFISTPLLRFTPRRILPIWGLTNGINAVMIECVHGGKHTCPQNHVDCRSAVRSGGVAVFIEYTRESP
jgi:hypothetical protein